MPQLQEHFESWIGRTLNDGSGHKVGKIHDIYTDDDTGQPEWLAITTGLFGSNVSFVPVAGAALAGDDVQVQFPKDQVKDAPNAGADGKLSEAEEARLYAHYGLDYDQERVRLQRWVEAERPGSGMARDEGYIAGQAPLRGDREPLDDRAPLHRGGPTVAAPVAGGSWADEEEIADDEPRLGGSRAERFGEEPMMADRQREHGELGREHLRR